MEDAQFNATFESYVKHHYESWVTFACDKEYGNDVKPILVSGFDMTRDYAMLAYSNKGISLEAGVEINALMFASASASVTVTRHTECSPHFKCGPEPWGLPQTRTAIEFSSLGSSEFNTADPRATPNEFNQCVFIRYYTARLRKWMPPKVFRAGAGPHDLGSGDNTGDTFPELTVHSGAEATTSDEEHLGGQSDITTDDTGSEPFVVVRNTPCVWFSPHLSHFRPNVYLQDEEYDSWDVTADYVFQVVPFPVFLPRHSTLSMEEFRCGLRIDAPPRFRRDPYGKTNEQGGFRSLTLG